MVRPARFAFNPQTAESNAFQSDSLEGLAARVEPGAAQREALREFSGLADRLARAGVTVIVAPDTADPIKPDAVFPNNWVSFHHDGTVVLYPMLAQNRRWERREEVLRQVLVSGFRALRTVDLSTREQQGRFLEGTGSMVLDRANRVAYAALSPRTDLGVLGDFALELGYELLTFEAADSGGKAVYHTNVLMAVGASFAVICLQAVKGTARRAAVADKLSATGHRLIDISLEQMRNFAGNLLELAPAAGAVIALSTTAWGSLDRAQRRSLEAHGSLLVADIPVIERLGGGGVRCMLAEIHLPRSVAQGPV